MRIRRAALDAVGLAGGLLVCLLAPPLWAALPGEGVHFPTDSAWSNDYVQVGKHIDEKDWSAVEEGLTHLFQTVEEGRRADGGGPVYAPGSGYALGRAAALERLLRLVPADVRARFLERAGGILEQRWTAAADSDPAGAELLRHRLLRDYPWSALARESAMAALDRSLVEGRLEDAAAAGEFLLGQENLDAEAHARAAWLLWSLESWRGDAEAWTRAGDSLRASLDAGALPELLGEEIKAALERPLSPPHERAARQRVRSPILLADSAGAGGRYELGSIQARRRLELTELNAYLDQRLPSGLPIFSPSWLRSPVAEGEPAEKGSPAPPHPLLTAATSRRSPHSLVEDFPIPFLPVAHGSRLYLQTYQECLAYSLPDLKLQWATPLRQPSFETLGAMRAPAIGASTLVASSGDSIQCLDLATGVRLWQRSLAYDRAAKTVVLRAPRPDAAAAAPAGAEPNLETGESLAATLTAPAMAGELAIAGVSVELEGEVLCHLAAFDRFGALRWRTYLGSAQNSNHLGLGATLSPPWHDDGRVLVLTNLGFLACVDARDGEVLWMSAYERLSDRGKVRSIQDGSRWQLNPLARWRNQVLAAPQDAAYLFGFDLKSGEALWRLPRDRHATLLGTTAAGCILGGAVVSAVELRDPQRFGTIAWQWQAPEASLIALGRAWIEGDSIYVSDLNALYTLNLHTGALNGVALWDYRGGGGNLLLLDSGQLAVASAGGFFVYNHREEERRRIDALPRDSQESLLESARLALKGGDVASALQSLRDWKARGFSEAPPNSAIDHLLFQISELLRYTVDLLAGPETALQANGVAPAPDSGALGKGSLLDSARAQEEARSVELLQALFYTERLPEFKAVAAFRCAQTAIAQKRYQEAMDVIQEAMEQDLGEVSCPVNRFLAIPGRVFAEGLLSLVRRGGDGGEAAFTNFEWTAQERLAAARRQGTQTAFEKVARVFPLTRASAQAHLELAQYYQDQQNLAESMQWLLNYLRHFPNAPDYSAVVLRAADLCAQTDRYAEARDLLLGLARERPDERLEAPRRGGLGQTVKGYVEARLRDPGFQDIPAASSERWLRFPIQIAWRSPANLLSTGRQFLSPEGGWPQELKGRHFLTISRELLECRSLETGLPRWSLQFGMLPSFRAGEAMSGLLKTARGSFLGDLLVLHDLHNLVGVDALKGAVQWQQRIDQKHEEESPVARAFIQPVAEQISNLAVGPSGIFVRSTWNRLHRYDTEGREVFNIPLPLEITRYKNPMVVVDGRVVLFRQAPLELLYLDARTGAEDKLVELREQFPDLPARIVDVEVVSGDRAVVVAGGASGAGAKGGECIAIDLREGRILSRYRSQELALSDAWTFPAYADQVIVQGTAQQRLALLGISIASGAELWRYDEFAGSRPSSGLAKPQVYADDTRLFVLHGGEVRQLSAIDIRPGPDAGGYTALRLWKENIELGMVFGRELDLLITQDSILYPDPVGNLIWVYDKQHAANRNAVADTANRFLADKRSGFQARVIEGTLVFLTDRGDAAFTSRSGHVDLETEREKLDRLRRYLVDPKDWTSVIWLALNFFREGNSSAALEILNTSLLSEHLPSLDSPGKYQELKFLLDGIKEEAVKGTREEIACRRLRIPPKIDGKLEESWNLTTRRVLADHRHINLIPSPGQDAEIWKGEEDLSATLYTGWDDDFFYFAFDVQDNRIYPYDKESGYWKGDCLLIGLDPEGDGGLYQNGNDQLLTLALTIPKRNADKGENGEDEEEDERTKPEGKYSVRKKDDDSGVVYEAAIPWSSFRDGFRALIAESLRTPPELGSSYTPMPGKRFGLSLVVTDDDTGQGATKMLSATPCHLLPRDQSPRSIWRHLIPEYFPLIKLE